MASKPAISEGRDRWCLSTQAALAQSDIAETASPGVTTDRPDEASKPTRRRDGDHHDRGCRYVDDGSLAALLAGDRTAVSKLGRNWTLGGWVLARDFYASPDCCDSQGPW